MYKAVITVLTTGKKYGEGRVFKTEVDAQSEVERLLKKKHIFTPPRSIRKGQESYPSELFVSEQEREDEDGLYIEVFLKANYEIEIGEIESDSELAINERLKVVRKKAEKSKKNREDCALVMDAFIASLDDASVSSENRSIMQQNQSVLEVVGMLNFGRLGEAKKKMLELQLGDLVPQQNIDDVILLTMDLLKKRDYEA